MRDTAISLKFQPDFSVDFPWFLLRISEDSPDNQPLIYLLWIHQKIPKESMWKIPSISMWILVSLPTQIFPWIPLHHGSAIPGDSPQNPRDFARWEYILGINEEVARDLGTQWKICLWVRKWVAFLFQTDWCKHARKFARSSYSMKCERQPAAIAIPT